MTKPHTTWDTFSLFFKDYTTGILKAKIGELAKHGYTIEGVEARSTKNANCHMITLKWSVPVVDEEKQRNKRVLQGTSGILPVSGDIKLFWHKPGDKYQIIDATVLIWS